MCIWKILLNVLQANVEEVRSSEAFCGSPSRICLWLLSKFKMPIVVLASDTEYEHCMWILEKNQHATQTSTTNKFVDMDMYLVTSLPNR